MKRIFTIFILLSILLSGCGTSRKYVLPEEEDFVLSYDCTNKDIGIGDTSEEFVKAYNGYLTSVIYQEDMDELKTIKIENIDFNKNVSVFIAYFFIDGKAIDKEKFKQDNNFDGELNDYFEGNEEYLKNHKVEFRCLTFNFVDGKVSEINPKILNYNE